MQCIKLDYLVHRGREWIALKFECEEMLNRQMELLCARWTKTHACWLLPCTRKSMEQLRIAVRNKAELDWGYLKKKLAERKKLSLPEDVVQRGLVAPNALLVAHKLADSNRLALRQFLETLHLKAYSASTIRTYRNEFLQLLIALDEKPVEELRPEELRAYLEHCLQEDGLKEATVHSRINALKFYFEQVLRRDKFFFDIPRPTRAKQLPRIFNRSEITRIIQSAGSLKNRVMLMLAYSAGLRVSEVVKIRAADIDSGRMCIFIKRAKGKKDRMVTLSPIMLVMLREYWKQYKPSLDGYLFQGQSAGQPYSTRSLQLVLERAKKRAGILKPGSIHAFRHSFATHLLDKGTDVTMIMKLMGHNDIRTTLRYLHVTNRDMMKILSPLDDLALDLP